MAGTKCPVCGCEKFYVKNPDDEFDVYEFDCKEGKICFDQDIDEGDPPQILDETQTYCDSCAWHDRFDKLK